MCVRVESVMFIEQRSEHSESPSTMTETNGTRDLHCHPMNSVDTAVRSITGINVQMVSHGNMQSLK